MNVLFRGSNRQRFANCRPTVAIVVALAAISSFAWSGPWAGASSKHQLGVNVQFYDYGLPNATLTFNAHETFAFVKSNGGNAVSITIPFEVPSTTANTVMAATWTPTPARVGTVVKAATALGLSVMLRPIIDERNLPGAWRGAFKPANPTLWFQNYLKFLKPYLQLAQSDKVATFDIASELQGTYKLAGWTSTIAKAKAWFTRTIEVSSSWGNGATVHHKGATSGIDAYLGTSLPPTATVPQLLAAWNANYKAHPFPDAATTTTLTEVGIAAQDGAYKKPNRPHIGTNTPIDAQIQTNWFTAACQFAHQHALIGIYFWRLNIGGNPNAQPTPSDPTLFAASSVTAIKACFTTF
jgi:hypothetical protein